MEVPNWAVIILYKTPEPGVVINNGRFANTAWLTGGESITPNMEYYDPIEKKVWAINRFKVYSMSQEEWDNLDETVREDMINNFNKS
jgi:hypothetical protein